MTVYQLPLRELQGLPELKLVEARLREMARGDDSCTPHFSSVVQGGKRLRGALVILCGSFLSAQRNEIVDVATAVELIHAASLVHDDVIDCAESRRGMPTVSSQWGDHQAVLYGDFLFAKAFHLLTGHGLSGVLANMTRAISLMCEGEMEQYALRYNCQQSETDYMSYIHKKTAFFLSACCLAGAEICGLSTLQQKILASYGLQLGYAFQIKDDLLDICGETRTTGKPVLHDLTVGCLTLPVIKLLYDPYHSARVRDIINSRDFSQDSLLYIRDALISTGIVDEVSQKARILIVRAKQNLARLPNRPARLILARLADFVLQRNL